MFRKFASFLIIAMIGLTSISLQSCKKCHVCEALDEDGDSVYAYPEVCGSKGDLEEYEERCKVEFGSFGYTCSCGERE